MKKPTVGRTGYRIPGIRVCQRVRRADGRSAQCGDRCGGRLSASSAERRLEQDQDGDQRYHERIYLEEDKEKANGSSDYYGCIGYIRTYRKGCCKICQFYSSFFVTFYIHAGLYFNLLLTLRDINDIVIL